MDSRRLLVSAVLCAACAFAAPARGETPPPPPPPANDCATDLEQIGDDPKSVEKALAELPPLALDSTNIKASLDKLLRDVRELNPELVELRNIENALNEGRVSPREAAALAQGFLSKTAGEAARRLNAGQKFAGRDRKILEGYRILMDRAQRVKVKAEEQLEDQQHQQQRSQAGDDNQRDQSAQNSQKQGNQQNQQNEKSPSQSSNMQEQSPEKSSGQQQAGDQKQQEQQQQQDSQQSSVQQKQQPNQSSAQQSGDKGRQEQTSEPMNQSPRQNNDGDFIKKASEELERKKERFQPGDQKAADRPLGPVDRPDMAEILKKYLDALYVQVLRQYSHHDAVIKGLQEFSSICTELDRQFEKHDFLMQYAARSNVLRERLELNQIRYNSLEELGLSLLANQDGDSRQLLRKLRFVDSVLSELGRVSSLTDEESRVHDFVRALLAALENGKKNISDKELGEAFVAQLGGPLSRKTIVRTYKSANPAAEVDWAKLAHDLRTGKLDDLAVFGRMRPYMNVFLNNTMKPKFYKTHTGPKMPVNEQEPDLETAEELDRLAYFYRDGAPLKTDLLRLLSGDMLERSYREEVDKSDPKKPLPKHVSIVVYDISGSMQGEKEKFRNALMGAYVDKTQIEVVKRQGEHVVYLMAFESEPHEPERVAGLQQAQEYFDRLREHPKTAGGNTNITDTLVKVYELIAKHEKEGGELSRANILFVTDGEADIDFNRIKRARDKVGREVEVVMNAITMGDKNEAVENLVRQQGGIGPGQLGRVGHQHVDLQKMKELMNARTRLDALSAAAENFDSAADHQVDNQELVRLKHELTGLENKRELKDKLSVNASAPYVQQLRLPPATARDPEFDGLMNLFIRVVKSPATGMWSRADKIEALKAFLDNIESQRRLSPNSLLHKINGEDRQVLLDWIR